jgi:hypothetical protein
VESDVLAQVWVVLEPAVLGFEAKNPPLLHDHKAHDQRLMLVDKRPDTLLKIASLFSYAVESPGS